MGSRNRFAAGASGFNWSPWQVEPQQLLPPHSDADADADAAAAAAMVHSHPHPHSQSHSSSHSQPFGYGGEVENQGLYGGGGGVGHVHSSAAASSGGSSASTFGASQYRNAGAAAAAAGSDLSIQIQMQMQMSHHHHHHHHQNHHLSSSSSSSYHYQDQEEQAQSHRNNNHHHQHNMNSGIHAGALVRGPGYPFSVAKTEPCASSSSSIMDATDLNLAVSSFNLNIKRPRTVNMHGGGSVVVGGVTGAGTAAATGLQVPICQAEGCWVDLTCAKHYYKRHRVCEFHSKATTVSIGGRIQRFCQQCSRFHSLQDFDEGKRSCRKRLAEHNRRRRKSHVGNCDSALIASADVSSGDDHSSSVADSANSNSATTTTSTALNLYPHSSAAAAAAMAMGVGVAMNMSSRTAMNHHNVNNVAAEDLAHHNNNHHQHLRRGEESFWGLRHASASDEIHFDALAGSSAINKYEDDEDEDRHSHRQRHRHRREEEEEDDEEEDNDDDENDNDDDCDGGGGGSIRFSHSFLPVGRF